MSSQITTTKTTKTIPNKKKEYASVTKRSIIRPSKPKRRKQRKSKFSSSALPSCYIRTLDDPFDNPPCKLGFATMVPTNLATLYFRGNLPVNSDGSIAIFVSPACGTNSYTTTAGIHYNNSGLSGTLWTHAPWFNTALLTPQTQSARVVSCGLKVLPVLPRTDSPPICYAGAVSAQSTTQFIANSPSTALAYPSLEKFVSYEGYLVKSRPRDNAAYEFSSQTMDNIDAELDNHSTPWVVVTGMPTGTIVTVDAILHLEYIPTAANINTSQYSGNSNAPSQEETVSSYFPSMEQMWKFVEPKLSNPAVLNFVNSQIQGMFVNNQTPQ